MLLIYATNPGGTLTLRGSDATTAKRGPWLSTSGVGWSIGLLTWLIPVLGY